MRHRWHGRGRPRLLVRARPQARALYISTVAASAPMRGTVSSRHGSFSQTDHGVGGRGKPTARKGHAVASHSRTTASSAPSCVASVVHSRHSQSWPSLVAGFR